MTLAAKAPRSRRIASVVFGLLLVAVSASGQQMDCSESQIVGQLHAKEDTQVLRSFLIGAAGAIVGGAMASRLIVGMSAETKGMGLYAAAATGAVLGAFWPVAATVVYAAVSVPVPLNPDPDVIDYGCFSNGYEQAARAPRAGFALLGGAVGMAAIFGVASLLAVQVYGLW